MSTLTKIVTQGMPSVLLSRPGPKCEMAATNDLGEGVLATPAVCRGQIFVRTSKHLYCIGSSMSATHD